MELAFEIEDALSKAGTLKSTLMAVTDSAYHGGYDFADYEDAFYHLYELAYDLSKDLQALTDKAFELYASEKQEQKHNKAQVLHMQAERM